MLFEYTRIGDGMEFLEMIVSPRYCVDRAGETSYVGDARCKLRWGMRGGRLFLADRLEFDVSSSRSRRSG